MRYILFLFFGGFIYAQNDTIQVLEEVELYGHFSKKINAGYQIQILSDSIINNSVQSLGDLLQSKVNLYFKQNGNGMVSSISLRGSGASHTGIYWNGIAINSSLNGQTDFNTLSANGFNQIEIRKGAGSTLFGSGAIGGAINLKDDIKYRNKNKISSKIAFGSYNTKNLFLQTLYNNSSFFAKISMEGNKSDNDYPFLETEITNENGKYRNNQIKSAFGYKINTKNQLQLFTHYSYNYRELSRTITAPSKNLYINTDNKLLLNWINKGITYNSTLSIAYLNEIYQFYLDKDYPNFSFGETNNWITKYSFNYQISKKTTALLGIENKYTKSNGSNILKKERNILEYYALFHQQIQNKLSYNISARKGNSNTYTIPFIYALDTKYTVNQNINFRANYSTNYRIPTFNDLYWEYSGNEDLIPETSNSIELGFYYKNKFITTSVLVYKTESENLIQWKPVSATFWKPINIQSVTSEGIELDINFNKKLQQHHFEINSLYSYTKSTDNALNKQLMYVPKDKLTTNITYTYKNWGLNYSFQYNGSVFKTTSNTQIVEEYRLHTINFYKKINNNLTIGFYINNLYNENYQIVSYRPMPNRNYKLNINIKL